jgi:hypothetical protein
MFILEKRDELAGLPVGFSTTTCALSGLLPSKVSGTVTLPPPAGAVPLSTLAVSPLKAAIGIRDVKRNTNKTAMDRNLLKSVCRTIT